MADFKRNILTMTIGGLVTAIGIVSNIGDMLFGPTQPTVGYVAPVVQVHSDFDWWWSKIMWSLLPIAIVAIIGCGIGIVIVAARNGKPVKTKKDDGGQGRMNQIITATHLSSTATAMPEQKKIHWLSQVEAIEQSKPRSWIIGQATEKQPNQEHARQAVGNLLTVDYQTTQFAILGGSGGGKTSSTGMLMLVHAKLTGLHPIVLDGKDGLDWGPLADLGIVEWYQVDVNNLSGYLGQLKEIYYKRHAVMRKFGKANIYDLPTSHYIQPLFVFIEEFGIIWDESGKDPELEKNFNFLSRMGRAAGIVICPIDQTPAAWSAPMRGNAKFAVCYNTNGKALNGFEEYHAGELPLKGVFSRGNVFYKAWHTAKEWNVGAMAPIQRRYLVAEGGRKNTNDGANHERTPTNAGSLDAFAPEASHERTNEPKSATPVALPPSLVRSFVRDNDWDKAAAQYFKLYPDSEHIDWCKAMALLADDGREYTAFKGGLSQRLFHAYSPKGKKQK